MTPRTLIRRAQEAHAFRPAAVAAVAAAVEMLDASGLYDLPAGLSEFGGIRHDVAEALGAPYAAEAAARLILQDDGTLADPNGGVWRPDAETAEFIERLVEGCAAEFDDEDYTAELVAALIACVYPERGRWVA